jgi:heme exporter protein C
MRDKILIVLGAVAILLLARDLYLITGFPPERAQGAIFKIIFFHVPMAITAFVFALVAFLASILFLLTRRMQFDALAVAVSEVGLAFLAGNLITGSIWARVQWGIWWTWDARLTSALVCWLLYAGYLMLRHSIDEPTQRATIAAVFSIFAFIDVPIVTLSIQWWRTQHPQPVFWGGGSFQPDWKAVFDWQLLAILLVGVLFVSVRLRQEQFQREIDSLRRMAHAI